MNGRVSVDLLLAMVFPLDKNIKALYFASLFYSQLYRPILVALYPSVDAMQSCLLTPFKGVNAEAIGLYAIIFDGLYGS